MMNEWFSYELVGETRDDAIGEAFDKVARLLDMQYPGGPLIAEFASRARERGEEKGIVFPRPMAHDDTCDFSFSGLKTAVLYKLKAMDQISLTDKENIAEAFEDAARDVILIKTERAIEMKKPRMLAVGGGVSANEEIRNGLKKLISEKYPDIILAFPDKLLTGDNAIMVGVAGYLRHTAGKGNSAHISAEGNLRLHI
jgi:N6-L-threonylcarbamoyladenine synthase